MLIFIKVSAYVAVFGALFLLIRGTRNIIQMESKKKRQASGVNQALQMVTAGFIIILVSLILSLFFSLLILIALPGLYLAYSNVQKLKGWIKNDDGKNHLQVINTSLIVALGGLLFITGMVVNARFHGGGNSEALVTDEGVSAPAATEEGTIEAKGVRYVVDYSYARGAALSNAKILGVCSPKTEVNLIKKQDGFYYVKGAYKKGSQGKGSSTTGKFWISASLLSNSKTQGKPGATSHWPSQPKTSPTAKKSAGKSSRWPNF